MISFCCGGVGPWFLFSLRRGTWEKKFEKRTETQTISKELWWGVMRPSSSCTWIFTEGRRRNELAVSSLTVGENIVTCSGPYSNCSQCLKQFFHFTLLCLWPCGNTRRTAHVWVFHYFCLYLIEFTSSPQTCKVWNSLRSFTLIIFSGDLHWNRAVCGKQPLTNGWPKWVRAGLTTPGFQAAMSHV